MSGITTHVLDTAAGRPAEGVTVTLERQNADGSWHRLAQGHTDQDGRQRGLLPSGKLEAGYYRLIFHVEAYFKAAGTSSFYRQIPIEFAVENSAQHYHVPLLLSPFGYSTYRGS